MGGTAEIGVHFANPPRSKPVMMLVDLLANGDGFLRGADQYADTSKWDHWRVLHESAMYFECQAEFDEISRAR